MICRKNNLFFVLLGLVLFINSCSVPESNTSNESLLQSGPMVGYSTMKEVALWVQTTEAARVQFKYWDKDNPEKKFITEEKVTEKGKAFAVQLIADWVMPGKKYEYALYIDSKRVERPYPLEFQSQANWSFRTDPPDFKFALGSCTYINDEFYDRPGEPYGGEYEIFDEIYKQHPDFMLWGGDNVYLREADWNSKTGILYRYTHTRSLPEMQPLLGSVHHYALWDDHDYGPNDSDKSYWNKNLTLEAFKTFWSNPNYVLGENKGITGTFIWSDVQFFLLDNRWFRTSNQNKEFGERVQLGQEQLDWLINALSYSKASFKFIVLGGQVLNPSVEYEGSSFYPEETKKLIKTITDLNIRGVIFLSGDRHHTELTKLPRKGTYPLYDLTVSPLTSGAHRPEENDNFLYEEGTFVDTRNFAVMEVAGPRKDRVLGIKIIKSNGTVAWERKIKETDLAAAE